MTPAGTSNELDVQNEREETHTHTQQSNKAYRKIMQTSTNNMEQHKKKQKSIYGSRNILMSACRAGFAAWAERDDIFALRRKCPAPVFPADCANYSSLQSSPAAHGMMCEEVVFVCWCDCMRVCSRRGAPQLQYIEPDIALVCRYIGVHLCQAIVVPLCYKGPPTILFVLPITLSS